MHRLDAATWPDVAASASATLLVVPIGSTEQHGPHLPLSTDTLIATALAERLAERVGDAVVAPAVTYGSSGEHAGFAGTLSIGGAVLESVLVELGRSADAFAGVVFVNGHGGNAAPLSNAVALLQRESRRVMAWSPRVPGGDAHAGRTETSLMLALHPSLVVLERAEAGEEASLRDLMPALRAGGLAAVSANGVLGNPIGATAEEGEALLAALVDDLALANDSFFRRLSRPSRDNRQKNAGVVG